MRALLVRVAADQTETGGRWNSPVRSQTGDFVYAAISENAAVRPGMERPYDALSPALATLGVALPDSLAGRNMHLDPDFDHLTYGDLGQRGQQLRRLNQGDLIVFYAGLADTDRYRSLRYALIGMYVIDEILDATAIPADRWGENAHTRRILPPGAADVVIRAKPGVSGRLRQCIAIGEYRDRAYRVRRDLLVEWGGLSVRDGYLQRSVRLPSMVDPERFVRWLDLQAPELIQANNPGQHQGDPNIHA